MLTLYQRTDCPFCWKVRIALAHLGIEYRNVDTVLGEKHPVVQRVSPTGTVPVMVDGDVEIWESGVILDYLDTRYAPGTLFPADPAEATRVRLLHAYSDKVVGACIRDVIFEKRSKPESRWDRHIIVQGRAKWRNCLDYLESALAGRQFFGAAISAADCALAARIGVAEAYGEGLSSEEHPGLFGWYEGMCKWTGWQVSYPTSFIQTDQ